MELGKKERVLWDEMKGRWTNRREDKGGLKSKEIREKKIAKKKVKAVER